MIPWNAVQLTEVYRAYDKADNLLYVGIAKNTDNRLVQHRRDSAWFNDMARVETKLYFTKNLALHHERLAIIEENPQFNVTYNEGVAPSSKQAHRSESAVETASPDMHRAAQSLAHYHCTGEGAYELDARQCAKLQDALVDSGNCATTQVHWAVQFAGTQKILVNASTGMCLLTMRNAAND